MYGKCCFDKNTLPYRVSMYVSLGTISKVVLYQACLIEVSHKSLARDTGTARYSQVQAGTVR